MCHLRVINVSTEFIKQILLNSTEHDIHHSYTVVDILTFISMTNRTSESLKARTVFSILVFISSVNCMFFLVELSINKVLFPPA